MNNEQYIKIENALNNENNEGIMKLTKREIMSIKNNILQQIGLSSSELKDIHKRLKDYRYIDEIDDVNYGSYIRWIPLNKEDDIRLRNGGIICDIKILDNGLHIFCKNGFRLMQIKFDENLVFQKLTQQEKIILNVLNYIN
jgi:hypothetical protein